MPAWSQLIAHMQESGASAATCTDSHPSEEDVQMVTCPRCGGSSAIDIVPDPELPWVRTPTGASARWSVTCRGCGTGWTLIDDV